MDITWTRGGIVCGIVVVLCSMAGCATRMQPQVTTSEGLKNASVEVHLVGVRSSEYDKWANYSVSKYFSEGDPLRNSAVEEGYSTIVGLPDERGKKLGPHIHEGWKERGADYVFVLADLPGYSKSDDERGRADPRRTIVPLSPAEYPSTHANPLIRHGKTMELVIRVTGGGLIVDPEPAEHR